MSAPVNRFMSIAIATSLLSAGGIFSACTSDVSLDTRMRQEAEDLQKRTIPPNSSLLVEHSPTIEKWVARADWQFETDYSPDAYNHWVASKLQPDFQLRQTPNSGMRFSKHYQGDVETLSVTAVATAGVLRVTVRLEIYPD